MQRMSQEQNSSSANHIVIVGGGTSGWMTAALMSRHLSASVCEVTVVDSGDGGIGVGEATIPSLLRMLQMLGADETEFMRSCDATWKLGIQFSDWLRPGHDIWHPFGVCGATIDDQDLFPFWLADAGRQPQSARPYHSCSLHWAAALAGKGPHQHNGTSPITATSSYAFHLDAAMLARWLRQQAIGSGVTHVQGTVVDCDHNETGDVQSVCLADGRTVAGRFFIDCSGFDSVLMNSLAETKWIDWSNQLLCDRAVAISLPSAGMIPSHTTAQALSAGWCWDIPLFSRRGIGYVYSSQFVSDDAAIEELCGYARIASETRPQIRQLKLKAGRMQQPWKRNVLAIGLSAGFAEPLESSGLHLTQVGIERFLQFFPAGTFSPALRDEYNATMAAVFRQVRDFIQLHYHLNQRSEEADPHGFWQAARNATVSGELQHRLKLYSESGTLPPLEADAFGDTSYYFLLTGSQRLPRRPSAIALAADAERISFVLRAIVDQNRTALRSLPLHEEALHQIHSATQAKAS